jgi:hypothetical protein
VLFIQKANVVFHVLEKRNLTSQQGESRTSRINFSQLLVENFIAQKYLPTETGLVAERTSQIACPGGDKGQEKVVFQFILAHAGLHLLKIDA